MTNYTKITMKWANACHRCGEKLRKGDTGFGTKDVMENKWKFLCFNCYSKFQSDADADKDKDNLSAYLSMVNEITPYTEELPPAQADNVPTALQLIRQNALYMT